MHLVLNGETIEIPEQVTIADLLKRYPASHRGFAIEVNRKVIRRADHETYTLKPGDVVEVVTLVGGG